MSTVQVRPFRRSDRDQLTRLVNPHVEAVVPGMSATASRGWNPRPSGQWRMSTKIPG